MIWIDNRFFPLAAKSSAFTNTICVSPWTGQVWARVDRGLSEWQPRVLPARGETRSWAGIVPGSLYTDYEDWRFGILAELPRPLLFREVQCLVDVTSATEQCYNVASNGAPDMNHSLMQEIAALRAKEAAGTLTDEELRTILRKMREGRVTASVRSAASRTKAAAVDPDKALEAFLS